MLVYMVCVCVCGHVYVCVQVPFSYMLCNVHCDYNWGEVMYITPYSSQCSCWGEVMYITPYSSHALVGAR